MKHRVFVIAGVFACLLSLNTTSSILTVPAAAQQHEDAREALRRGEILPFSDIKRIVENEVEGRVVGQKLRRTNKGWNYDLRVRAGNGRVMVVVVDARSGRILSTR